MQINSTRRHTRRGVGALADGWSLPTFEMPAPAETYDTSHALLQRQGAFDNPTNTPVAETASSFDWSGALQTAAQLALQYQTQRANVKIAQAQADAMRYQAQAGQMPGAPALPDMGNFPGAPGGFPVGYPRQQTASDWLPLALLGGGGLLAVFLLTR